MELCFTNYICHYGHIIISRRRNMREMYQKPVARTENVEIGVYGIYTDDIACDVDDADGCPD